MISLKSGIISINDIKIIPGMDMCEFFKVIPELVLVDIGTKY
jgi:hypothetical protein